MPASQRSRIPDVLAEHGDRILDEWIQLQVATTSTRSPLDEDQVREESRRFFDLFTRTIASDPTGSVLSEDVHAPPFRDLRSLLSELSRSRARQGFTPSETAMFVFSLKKPLFEQLRQALAGDAEALAAEIWTVTLFLDKLGLFTVESHLKGRDEIIGRQQRELLELSTPVVELWEGILALPLIGTLDSARTQVMMESLLQMIVQTGASIAIIEITGVPTVDTLVAQHLLKTVAAARLMGADCYISGIRPQIAQTIVQLGLDLSEVTTKANLADAFSLALDRSGMAISKKAGSPAR
jgi:rsbT co-antagonist protein RsbR